MARSRSAKPKDPVPEGSGREGGKPGPGDGKARGSGPGSGPEAKPRAQQARRPSPGRAEAAARAKLEAEAMRQAECAAMLIAVTRMLLDLRGRDFARWLRSIADDFDASDPEAETPEDLARDLIRLSREGEGETEGPDEEPGSSADEDGLAPMGIPPGRRHH